MADAKDKNLSKAKLLSEVDRFELREVVYLVSTFYFPYIIRYGHLSVIHCMTYTEYRVHLVSHKYATVCHRLSRLIDEIDTYRILRHRMHARIPSRINYIAHC